MLRGERPSSVLESFPPPGSMPVAERHRMSFERGSPVNSFPPAIVGTKIFADFSLAVVLGEGDVPLCARQRNRAAFLAPDSGA